MSGEGAAGQSHTAGEIVPRPGETLDSICGGAVRLLQREDGYRFNLDPVLLAHFAADTPLRGPILDLGTGSGIIPLILARKFGRDAITGLELQPQLFELARRNVRLNGCEEQVAMALGDIRQVRRSFPRASFSHIVSNPPYRARHTGLTNPEREKALARHELSCSIEDLTRAASWLLREGGMLHVIFPSARLAELLAALVEDRLTPRRLRMVHSRGHKPAQRVLLTAIKSAATGVTVLPPLVLHPDHSPGFTDEVRTMVSSPTGRPGNRPTGTREDHSPEV